MEFAHTPAMLNEILTVLSPKNNNSLFVDANTGEAGHSRAFLSMFSDLKVVCIDVDKDILNIAKERLAQFTDRVYFYNGWSYDFFTNYPDELKRPDLILFDLGISSYHYKKSGKGFSFEKDQYLDMRIDQNGNTTAADLLASLGEKQLADLIYNNSQEKHSRRIASLIVNQRQKCAITTTSALNDIINRAVPAKYRYGQKKGYNTHPATRVYQSLRIAVNGELEKLHELLEAALEALEPGGRFAVLSYHSGEDRIVKNFIKAKNNDCTCPKKAPICNCGLRSINVLTKKGITPTREEIERNPPSRSARLRVIEKVTGGEK